MMATPLISILMPVKNAGRFLKKCLDSILEQKYTNWELIAIDDHSDDLSFSILEEYQNSDKRIQAYSSDGNGIIEALRMAFLKSRGEYITRMDADDYMAVKKLALLIDPLIEQGRNHLAVGQVEYFSDTNLGEGYRKYANWLNALTDEGKNFDDIYKECSIPSPCWMVHRQDLENCGAFNPDVYPEDYDLAFRFRKANFKILGISEVLHYWRDHQLRSSRNLPAYTDNRFTALKVLHFVGQDLVSDKTLVLWGSGSKGKQIAKALIEKKVDFRWISGNKAKVGKDIYSKIIETEEVLQTESSLQVIIAISALNAKLEIEKIKSEWNHHSYFMFC